MSFLDCHWILLRHLEFKKIQGIKTDSAECRKIVIFICFTFSLSYCFLSYIFNFLKIFLHIFSYRKIDSRWNEYYFAQNLQAKIFFYIKLHTMLHVTTLRDFVMKFKPCTAKFLFCSICIYIWVYVYYFSIQ